MCSIQTVAFIYLLEVPTRNWASVVPVSDMLRKLFTVVVEMLSAR